MKKIAIAVVVLLVVQAGMAFAQARVPLVLPGTVSDANSKGTKLNVTAPNILSASGNKQDMSQINFKDLPYGGQNFLIVKITAMEGKFRWDKGKMFGINVGGKDLLPTGARVYKILDKFVDGPHEVGEELKFDLKAAGATGSLLSFRMVLYAGASYTLEFWLE